MLVLKWKKELRFWVNNYYFQQNININTIERSLCTENIDTTRQRRYVQTLTAKKSLKQQFRHKNTVQSHVEMNMQNYAIKNITVDTVRDTIIIKRKINDGFFKRKFNCILLMIQWRDSLWTPPCLQPALDFLLKIRVRHVLDEEALSYQVYFNSSGCPSDLLIHSFWDVETEPFLFHPSNSS